MRKELRTSISMKVMIMEVTTSAGEATKFRIVRKPKSLEAIPTYHLGPVRQLTKISNIIVKASMAVTN